MWSAGGRWDPTCSEHSLSEVVSEAEVGEAGLEPLDHFGVEGDASFAALDFGFVLFETGVDDAVGAGRGGGFAEGLEVLVHVALELVDIGEGGDVEDGEVVPDAV